jgi:hypothetical protein
MIKEGEELNQAVTVFIVTCCITLQISGTEIREIFNSINTDTLLRLILLVSLFQHTQRNAY